MTEPLQWQWQTAIASASAASSGFGIFSRFEDYPRHLLHLLLLSASVTDDALFDLQGRILENRDTVLLRGEDENAPSPG